MQYFGQEANDFVNNYLVAVGKLVYTFKVQQLLYDSLVDKEKGAYQIDRLESLL